ncbi:hypothetical protein [Tahibacter amnicola]|uniref:Uncharacterized protein n=1 Tax=Tahibacter amnicola TaxID=2976241 RepID=A0ABY6BDC0_9GAMM|nr:hypothetical protein [Tahibacter amnicola]UXI67537.1 hypothetical protein N4264_22815 [Tahibacter amnicola]
MIGGWVSLDAAAASVWVLDGTANAVHEAEVWVNCELRATTDRAGKAEVALAAGDRIVVRKRVISVPSTKGLHDYGWAWNVWHTNVVQNNDGTWTDWTVTDPAAQQQIVISRHNGIIGLNLMASIAYNASPRNVRQIRDGFDGSSRLLFDVTDGQMVLERVSIHEEGFGLASADVQIFAEQWPRAHVGGKAGLQDPASHIFMPGPHFVGQPWNSYTTNLALVHELGHYAIGAEDEYGVGPSGRAAKCTVDREKFPLQSRASIMDGDGTEFCHDGNHSMDTTHGGRFHTSVWGTLVANWDDHTLDLRTPMSRGTVNPGPTTIPCMFRTQFRIEESSTVSCPRYTVTTTYNGAREAGVEAALIKGGERHHLGITNKYGNLPSTAAFDVSPGDQIDFTKTLAGGPSHFENLVGSTIVEACEGEVVALKPYRWHVPYWIPKLDLVDKLIRLEFPLGESPIDRTQLEVLVGQPGIEKHRVEMLADEQNRRFVGRAAIDMARGDLLEMTVRVEQPDSPPQVRSSRIQAAMFHPQGPGTGVGGMTPPVDAVDGLFNLFAPGGEVGLQVDRHSLEQGAVVTTATTVAPVAFPGGWHAVSAIVSIAADQPLHDIALLRLRYEPTKVCPPDVCPIDPAQPISADGLRLVRFDGQEWQALSTTADAAHYSLYADIREWGIYAVIAREP